MNVELLQQIKARILAEPDAFRMDTWTCGTAHCIAGWACLLTGHTISDPDKAAVHQRCDGNRPVQAVAAEVLGISDEPDDVDDDSWTLQSEADRLFHDSNWPESFEERYDAAMYEGDQPDRVKLAQVAAERIDHFIATNGAE